jgi:hypothetical protein
MDGELLLGDFGKVESERTRNEPGIGGKILVVANVDKPRSPGIPIRRFSFSGDISVHDGTARPSVVTVRWTQHFSVTPQCRGVDPLW